VRHYFGVGDLKLMNGVGSNVQGSKEEMAIGVPCRNAMQECLQCRNAFNENQLVTHLRD
jgi:hypothetical protein